MKRKLFPAKKSNKAALSVNTGAEKSNKPKQTGRVTLARSHFVLVFLLVCMALLIYRLAVLQIISPDTYRNAAINQYTTEITMFAKRGNIYDRNMKILATSSTVQTVFISPADIKDEAQKTLIASGLSRILGVEESFVLEKAKNIKSKYQIIKRNVEEATEMELREFIKANDLYLQVCMEESTKRYYPYGNLASSIIGFVGADNTGLNGLELTYDDILSGINGRAIQGQDGLGNELPFQYESYNEAIDGTGCVYTIDYTIQSILEKYLRECYEENKPTYGCRAIIMDPNTGEILAMACIDDYNLNAYTELTGVYLQKYEAFTGTDEEKAKYKNELLNEMWKNRCVTELYEPGSTFKIITTAIGLEKGIFTLDSHYNCSGKITVNGITIHCHSSRPHGDQTVAQALVNSCNPAFVQMGLDIKGDLFSEYFKAFGYTMNTGSDILGESNSIYYSDLSNQLTLANCAFGQSMSITMLQHIAAVSSIANGGYVVTPHLIKSLVAGDGTVTDVTKYDNKRQVISDATAEKILTTLINSTKNAAVSGYNISSKTGTSQKLGRADAVEGESYYISSCVSFAPAEDPQIAILVVVDEPTAGIYYGSQVAAPVVGNVLTEVLDYLSIKPNDENQIKTVRLDDYKGSDTERAEYSIKSAGLNCVIVGNGTTVTEQYPRVGTTVTENGTVMLYTDADVKEETVKVKSLVEMTPEQVFDWIKKNHLNVVIDGVFNREFTHCYAVSQSVAAGTEVKAGSSITVTFMYHEEIE